MGGTTSHDSGSDSEKNNANKQRRSRQAVVRRHIGKDFAEFYEEGELAGELHVTTRTLRRWAVLRVGPPRIAVGRRILYRKASVIEWLLAREQRPLRRRSS
jgi:hypothetical protein